MYIIAIVCIRIGSIVLDDWVLQKTRGWQINSRFKPQQVL